ncbi:aminotransferase class V-fold PLP-dependent enzyme [Rhodospirillaceae bacterium SYSU D60014]|uniref:pyridoxal-phosphate-dependent aminotransferase family protein n=1 Tax=Virgifigura deserti TaxID=2268457 RepID=UPI000E675A79
MTVRHGREFLSIPGPTTVPDDVLAAMHRPAIDIYSGALIEVTASCLEDLRRLFRTRGRTYIYAANGHGAWEAALVNLLSKGDKILVLESGRFALGWGEMAAVLGIRVEVLPGNWRRAVDPAALEARLREDKAGDIKAVLVVQIDTASSVVNDIPGIRKAIDNAGHDALLMVDTIASLGTMPFDMDGWGVDVAVTGSQKGLMMPPGLSFVAANEKARAVHQQAGLRTHYWDWTARDGAEHYQKYCGTPPEHMLFGLRKALDMLFEEGLENVFERHRLLAEAVRRAVEAWGAGGALEFNITEPSERANSVTTVLTTDGRDPKPLLAYCEQKCGVVLGIGIGDLGGRALRIAHMGHVNAPMVLGTLAVLETGLVALGIPHGEGGVRAAVEWLGRSVPA